MKEQRQISMSEQRNIKGGPWQSEILEKPKKPKIGRRTALKLGAAAIGGAALVGAAAVGKKILEDLGVGLEPQESAQDNFFYEESKRLAESTHTPPTPFQPQPTPETGTPEPSPTPETYNAWFFNNIDLRNPIRQSESLDLLSKKERINAYKTNTRMVIDMGFFIGNDRILIPHFTPIDYYDGALEDGAFDPESNTGMTYLDGLNRKILNLHSGRRSSLDTLGFSAWSLQRYFEEYPESGVRRYPREVEKLLKNSLGSSAIARQIEMTSSSKMMAAARVPPDRVAESQQHVGDVIEWLGRTYPDSGFADLGKDHETLVIKYCGRTLSGEAKDESRPNFQQSRFFLALKKG